MFFIKSALEALETPGRPFIHDVNRPSLLREDETCRKAIASRCGRAARRVVSE